MFNEGINMAIGLHLLHKSPADLFCFISWCQITMWESMDMTHFAVFWIVQSGKQGCVCHGRYWRKTSSLGRHRRGDGYWRRDVEIGAVRQTGIK